MRPPSSSTWGFGSQVVPDEEVLPAALALAGEVVKSTSPFGLRLTKECLQASLDGTSFDSVVKLENRNQVMASNTQDRIDGVVGMRDRTPIVTTLMEVTDTGIRVKNVESATEQLIPIDTVILALDLIGDATTPEGKVKRQFEAIMEGYRQAMAI